MPSIAGALRALGMTMSYGGAVATSSAADAIAAADRATSGLLDLGGHRLIHHRCVRLRPLPNKTQRRMQRCVGVVPDSSAYSSSFRIYFYV